MSELSELCYPFNILLVSQMITPINHIMSTQISFCIGGKQKRQFPITNTIDPHRRVRGRGDETAPPHSEIFKKLDNKNA